MKRPLMGLVVCIAMFFVTREIIHRSGVHLPSRSSSETSLAPIQPAATSLPPLTNLAFRAGRAASPKPAANSLSDSITRMDPAHVQEPVTPADQTNEQNIVAAIATAASINPNRRDPMARVALSMVGIDPTAEDYWVAAINDPSLSDKEREDLIEDLNEAGFTDPQNPTAADIPLILNRLQLIEAYAPSAMDDTNARSFAEAYKDLSNMLARLTAQ
jgi:hypothetical protein